MENKGGSLLRKYAFPRPSLVLTFSPLGRRPFHFMKSLAGWYLLDVFWKYHGRKIIRRAIFVSIDAFSFPLYFCVGRVS
jgi:hypothetical protein